MNCPKCGQEMIHISNQHICTACGIVANELSPKSQVLAQIKAKASTKVSSADKQEAYVSPVAVATEDRPQSGTMLNLHQNDQGIPRAESGPATLDRIINEMSAAKGTTVMQAEIIGSGESYIEQGGEGEKTIPRLETENAGAKDAQQVQPQAQDVFVAQPTEISQAVYPSHQVSPAIIKILISAVATLVFCVIGYFLYANFSGIRGFSDNISEYIGRELLK